jgi:hypothetical protein
MKILYNTMKLEATKYHFKMVNVPGTAQVFY